jgi:hypothetical protein
MRRSPKDVTTAAEIGGPPSQSSAAAAPQRILQSESTEDGTDASRPTCMSHGSGSAAALSIGNFEGSLQYLPRPLWQGRRCELLNRGCHNGRSWMKMSVRTSFSSGRPPASAFTRGRGKNRVRTDAAVRPHGHGKASTRTHLPPLPSPLSLPPLGCPLGRLRGREIFFLVVVPGLEREKKIYNFQFSVFGFQSPNSPNSAGFAGEAARRRRFFRPSSPSHPSKLYSSLGWLNSKVPKPFPPFSLRLIDVDGF